MISTPNRQKIFWKKRKCIYLNLIIIGCHKKLKKKCLENIIITSTSINFRTSLILDLVRVELRLKAIGPLDRKFEQQGYSLSCYNKLEKIDQIVKLKTQKITLSLLKVIRKSLRTGFIKSLVKILTRLSMILPQNQLSLIWNLILTMLRDIIDLNTYF